MYKKKFYRWATVEFLTLVKQICLFNYKNELTTICDWVILGGIIITI